VHVHDSSLLFLLFNMFGCSNKLLLPSISLEVFLPLLLSYSSSSYYYLNSQLISVDNSRIHNN
jgi:hypothetical protein